MNSNTRGENIFGGHFLTPRVRHQLLEFGSSLCHVRLIEDYGARTVVIATELQENPGPSITNAVERLGQTIEQSITQGDAFDLILYHQPLPELSTEPYCRVTFDDRPRWSNPQWQQMALAEVERDVRVRPLPRIQLKPGEQLRLAALRQADEEERQQVLIQERSSIQIVALAYLPATEVDVQPTYYNANWPRIAHVAEQLLGSGIDPLDHGVVRREAKRRIVDSHDRSWLLSLFFDPIVVSLESQQYTNGRHRVHAMRRAGVRTCVVHAEPGYKLPGLRD